MDNHSSNMREENSITLSKDYILHDRYTIYDVIGVGGFGITYRAYDTVLETNVAIKEYFPSNMANRIPGQSTVSVYTEQNKQEFKKGLDRFLQEARDIAKFNKESNIVSVYDFFRENYTAYIVMEYLEGCTLAHYMKENEKIEEDFLIHITFSVMEALEIIHNAGVIHRDISPENIFICDDSRIKLLDFGAAKQEMNTKMKTVSVVLKHGYAPIEQYSKKTELGPWTDIYAFGATLYRLVTGEVPEESLDRVSEDSLKEPVALNPSISPAMNQMIMKAMAINKNDRFQTITEMRQYLLNDSKADSAKEKKDEPKPEVSQPEEKKAESKTDVPAELSKGKKTAFNKKKLLIPAIIVCLVVVVIFVQGNNKRNKNASATTGAATETAKEDIESSKSENTSAATTEAITEATTEKVTEADSEIQNPVLDDEDIIYTDYLSFNHNGFEFLLDNTILYVGETACGSIINFGTNESYYENLKFISSNPDVVSVTNGMTLTAEAPGVSLITCKFDGKTYGTYVSVVDENANYPVKLDVGFDELDFEIGGEYSYENQFWFNVVAEGDIPENVIMWHRSIPLNEYGWIVGSSWAEAKRTDNRYEMGWGSYPYESNSDFDYAFFLVNADNGEILGMDQFHVTVK